MIQVGGHAATLIDFEVPGGTACGRRSGTRSGSAASSGRSAPSPSCSGIASDMAELCPDAWLLNYTNPMAMLVLGDLRGHRR